MKAPFWSFFCSNFIQINYLPILMSKKIFIFFFLSLSLLTYAKETVVKDFDGDGKYDKIVLNKKTKTIDYFLSTQDYKKQSSLIFTDFNDESNLIETKNGFIFETNINDILYSSIFKYDKKGNNLVLIALKRKIISNDFSTENGESSIDTVSKEFIGKWNSLDKNTNKVIALPTLKTKTDLESITLNNFNDAYISKFNQQSVAFYKTEVSK
jgi:hypothetical protein